MGYSLWGHKESDPAEQLAFIISLPIETECKRFPQMQFFFSKSIIFTYFLF